MKYILIVLALVGAHRLFAGALPSPEAFEENAKKSNKIYLSTVAKGNYELDEYQQNAMYSVALLLASASAGYAQDTAEVYHTANTTQAKE